MSTYQEAVIKIGADVSEVIAKMRQAESSVGSAMSGMGNAVGLLQGAMAGLGVVMSTMEFVAFARRTIDAADAMNDMSQRVGIAVKDLAKYELASSQSGTTMEALAKGIKALGANLVEHGDALKKAGITATDADGALRQVADAFANMPDGIEKTNLAVKLFGKSGMDLIPMLNMGSQGLETAAEKSAKYAEQMEALAPAADEFNDNMAELGMRSKVFGMVIVNDVIPSLNQLTAEMLAAMKTASGFWDAVITMGTQNPFKSAAENAAAVRSELVGLEADRARFQKGGNDTSTIDTAIATMKRRLEYFKELQLQTVKYSKNDQSTAEDARLGLRVDTGDSYQKIVSALSGKNGSGSGGESAAEKKRKELEKLIAAGKELTSSLLQQDAGLSGDFLKKWDSLGTAYEHGAVSLGDLTKAQAQLLEDQPLIKAGLAAQEKELKRVEDANMAAAHAHTKFSDALRDNLVKLQADIEAQKEQNDRIGLSVQAIAELDAAKVESQAVALELLAVKKLDKDLDEEQYQLYMDQASALRNLSSLRTAGAGKQAAFEEFKGVWESVDRTAHDVFTNIFDGGQDAFTKLRDTLKATLLDLLYQMTVKRWIFDISASVSGSNVAAAAMPGMGGSAASGLGSLFGGGSGIGGMAGAFGSSLSSGFSSTIGSFGSTIGLSVEGGLASIAEGTSASIAGGLGQIAGSLAPVGLGIGALVALKNAMQYTVTPTGNALTATLSSSGIPSGQVGTRADFRQEGGFLGGGTTNNSTWGVADAGTTQYINDSVAAGTAAIKAYAASIGLSASAVDGFTKSIEVSLTGLDAAQSKAAIDTAIKGFFDDMVASSFDAIAGLQRPGEAASATLQRVAADLVAVNNSLDLLGYAALSASADGARAAASIVDAFGGLDQMNASVGYYYQNFYSESERAAQSAAQLSEQFSALGLSVPASREAFRELVDGIDITTTSGQSLAAAVLALAPAFDAVGSSAASAASTAAQAAAQMSQSMQSAVANWGTPQEQQDFKAQQLQQTLAASGLNVDMATISAATKESVLAYYKANPETAAGQALFKNQQAIIDFFNSKTGAAGSGTPLGFADSSGSSGGGGDSGGAGDSFASEWQRGVDAIVATMADLRKTLIETGPESFARVQAQFVVELAQARAGDLNALQDLPDLAKALIKQGEGQSASALEQALLIARTTEALAGFVGSTGGTETSTPTSKTPKIGGFGMVGEDRTLKWLKTQQTGWQETGKFEGYHVDPVSGKWVPDGYKQFGTNLGTSEVYTDPITGALRTRKFGESAISMNTPFGYLQNGQSKDGGNAEVVAVLNAVRDELVGLRASSESGASAAERTAKVLDAAAYGGQPLGTVAI